MFCARWLSASVALLAIGCSESGGALTRGTLESADRAGQRNLEPGDQSTDPAVSLLDAGADVPPATPPAEPPPPEPDAGATTPSETDDDEGADESDDSNGGGNNGNGNGSAGSSGSMTEPEPPPPDDNGGLVGTVCDLLGGLLCPVGLLCVDGLCQMPASN